MRLSDLEKAEFDRNIGELLVHKEVKKMKDFKQHRDVDTFTHSYTVAYYSYLVCLRLRIKRNLRSVVRGAMLHDFYLYDWHVPDKSHRLHGFFHPATSLKNAEKHFEIDRVERDIISTHMWPLTLTKIPKSRESFVICMVDKICSMAETIGLKVLRDLEVEREQSYLED